MSVIVKKNVYGVLDIKLFYIIKIVICKIRKLRIFMGICI